MGYYSTIYGEISFSPPLNHETLKKYEEDQKDEWLLFRFEIEEQQIDTPEGRLTKRWAESIVPTSDDSVKAYNVEGDLRTLLNYCTPETVFGGRFQIEGEENDDITRWVIKPKGDDWGSGFVIDELRPKIVWPE